MEGYTFVNQKADCLCKQEEILNKVKLEKKKRADITSRIGQLRFFTVGNSSLEPKFIAS